MLKLNLFLILIPLLFTAGVKAQIYTEKDVEICQKTFHSAFDKDLQSKPIGEIITTVGKSFLGTDYLPFGIEKEGEEQLVINLTGLDCTTFLENAVVFSRLIKRADTSFNSYMKELTLIRYRDGKIDRYPSRLHYFSDWIFNNQMKNIVKDISKDIGGKKVFFNLDFMSKHPQYYKHLKENPEFVQVIRNQENEISGREYYYIPADGISEAEKKIKNGDLIAFTTSIDGLDIGHVGIALKQNNRIHLLHAPQKDEKVQISKKPLAEYVKGVKKHTGIIVLRVIE